MTLADRRESHVAFGRASAAEPAPGPPLVAVEASAAGATGGANAGAAASRSRDVQDPPSHQRSRYASREGSGYQPAGGEGVWGTARSVAEDRAGGGGGRERPGGGSRLSPG
jgi:hypothetical protein